jgi:hypothetical protein
MINWHQEDHDDHHGPVCVQIHDQLWSIRYTSLLRLIRSTDAASAAKPNLLEQSFELKRSWNLLLKASSILIMYDVFTLY